MVAAIISFIIVIVAVILILLIIITLKISPYSSACYSGRNVIEACSNDGKSGLFRSGKRGDGPVLRIDSLDAAVVCWGQPTPFPTPAQDPGGSLLWMTGMVVVVVVMMMMVMMVIIVVVMVVVVIMIMVMMMMMMMMMVMMMTADLSQGVSFSLANNIWGTNYVMWVPFNEGEDDFLYRFALDV
jgi:hypothetical protein